MVRVVVDNRGEQVEIAVLSEPVRLIGPCEFGSWHHDFYLSLTATLVSIGVPSLRL
jgi:hypothetical protein